MRYMCSLINPGKQTLLAFRTTYSRFRLPINYVLNN